MDTKAKPKPALKALLELVQQLEREVSSLLRERTSSWR
jgi:hypothetical protein